MKYTLENIPPSFSFQQPRVLFTAGEEECTARQTEDMKEMILKKKEKKKKNSTKDMEERKAGN